MYTLQHRKGGAVKLCYENIEGLRYRLTREISANANLFGYDIETDDIRLDIAGRLTLKVGYEWNGADKPAINNQTIRAGSAFHDAIYKLIHMGLLPKQAKPEGDRLFKEINYKFGMWSIRRAWSKVAVSLFGLREVNPDKFTKQEECIEAVR